VITLSGSRLAADTVFESHSVERQNGILRVIQTHRKFFIKGSMMRMEGRTDYDEKLFLEHANHFTGTEQVMIIDATKGTALHIVPEYRAYSSEAWHPEHGILGNQKGPDITDTAERKMIGRWMATLRKVKTPRCNATVEQWVTSEPNLLRDLTTFEQLAVKSKSFSTDIPTGDRVFVLASKLTCPTDDPNKAARGALIDFQVDNVNLEAIDDPSLFALPAGFKEVTPDQLKKILEKEQKKRKPE
jgi:hypothetical protein